MKKRAQEQILEPGNQTETILQLTGAIPGANR
jgi:hypothetical protein